MDTKTIGERIRELRVRKGWTQIELSEGICTPSMISQIESDRAKPSYKILSMIAVKLETSMEQFLIDVEMNLQVLSNYKMARAMVTSKEYTIAIPLLKELMNEAKSQVETSDILLLLSECFLNTGELEQAEHQLEKLKVVFETRSNSSMLTEVLKHLGQIEFKRKQYEIAMYHFQNALSEMDKQQFPDVFTKAEILQFMGRVKERQGKIKQAIELFDQASELYGSKKSTAEMAGVFVELARSYQQINEPELSIEYSDRAHALYKSLDNVYMSLKVQMSSAIACGRSGKEVEAAEKLEGVIKELHALGKMEDVGAAYTELAKLQLALGDTEKASDSCRIARTLLPELHLYQAWVNRILAEIEMISGNRTEATRRFQMAADCFKTHGDIGEWSESLSKVSELKLEENDVSGAISIMRNIRLTTQNVLEERGIVL